MQKSAAGIIIKGSVFIKQTERGHKWVRKNWQ